MKRILICGGRDYDDYERFREILHTYWRAYGDFEIISGGARGADSMAERYAAEYKHEIDVFPADWDTHGRKAGPLRNQQMLDEGKPDLVIAFSGGTGTADMVRRAKKAGVLVDEID